MHDTSLDFIRESDTKDALIHECHIECQSDNANPVMMCSTVSEWTDFDPCITEGDCVVCRYTDTCPVCGASFAPAP